jgi:hypothetical protein
MPNTWTCAVISSGACRCAHRLQGPGFSSGVSGNTNLGLGSRTQPVHRDA